MTLNVRVVERLFTRDELYTADEDLSIWDRSRSYACT